MVIFIILYIVGVILTGTYLYKKQKNETFAKRVDESKLLFITIISVFFPIAYILGLLMIIIEKIGDKLCKDQ